MLAIFCLIRESGYKIESRINCVAVCSPGLPEHSATNFRPGGSCPRSRCGQGLLPLQALGEEPPSPLPSPGCHQRRPFLPVLHRISITPVFAFGCSLCVCLPSRGHLRIQTPVLMDEVASLLQNDLIST